MARNPTAGVAPTVTGVMVGVVLFSAVACGPQPLHVADEVVASARPEVLARVQANAYDYFRLANREWTARVCEIFAADLPNQPVVQLHGDAHVEQFAYLKDTWGLDDFDDAARGPALIDIVRFLGSIDLAARGRGWSRDRQLLFDRFFDGYHRGVSDSAYRPPEPAIVRRHRSHTLPVSQDEFLAWAQEQMQPLEEQPMLGAIASMKVFGELLRPEFPLLDENYFRVVHAGRLQMGVGSAATPKVLIRLEGPSADPSDDLVLEAKAVRARGALSCLETAATTPAYRVVQSNRQVGRLRHTILVAGPELATPEMTLVGQSLRDWWIRSWDPSYHEIDLDDMQSVADLADISYDVGVQLGDGAIAPDEAYLRRRLAVSIERDRARFGRAAEQLVRELLRGWDDFRGR